MKDIDELLYFYKNDILNLKLLSSTNHHYDEFTGIEYNDEFYLRFILASNNDFNKAVVLIKDCIKFRSKHKNVFISINEGKCAPGITNIYNRLSIQIQGEVDGYPCIIINPSHEEINRIFKVFRPNDIKQWFINLFELTFQQVTRNKHRKVVIVFDMKEFSALHCDKRFFYVISELNYTCEYAYPEFIHMRIFLNTSFLTKLFFKYFKRIRPLSSIKKDNFCMGQNHDISFASSCPFAKERTKGLPISVGGHVQENNDSNLEFYLRL